MSHHVKITRAGTGRVFVSRTFRTESAAQREADAWNHAGEFARYGQTAFSAEVMPGPSPAAPCGIRVCTMISPHRH